MTRDALKASAPLLDMMAVLQEDREIIASYIQLRAELLQNEIAEGNDRPVTRMDVVQILSNIAGAIRSGRASEC